MMKWDFTDRCHGCGKTRLARQPHAHIFAKGKWQRSATSTISPTLGGQSESPSERRKAGCFVSAGTAGTVNAIRSCRHGTSHLVQHGGLRTVQWHEPQSDHQTVQAAARSSPRPLRAQRQLQQYGALFQSALHWCPCDHVKESLGGGDTNFSEVLLGTKLFLLSHPVVEESKLSSCISLHL